MKQYGFLLFLWLSCSRLSAQLPEEDTLSEVRIQEQLLPDSRERLLPGSFSLTFDAETIANNRNLSLDKFLQRHTSVFIRSGGINSNATLNIRGSSAAQNSVLWNGININNAALGATDLSMIPVGLFSKVSLVTGANTAVFGNGSTGGTLLLANDISFGKQQRTEAYLHYNTLQNGDGQLHVRKGGKKWLLNIGMDGKHQQYAFSYQDKGVEERMTNALFKTGSIQADMAYLIKESSGKQQYISAHTWLQGAYREIPRALFEPVSLRNQQSGSGKYLLRYAGKTVKTRWNIRTAYLQDRFRYQDEAISIQNEYITRQWLGGADFMYLPELPFLKQWEHTVYGEVPFHYQQLYDLTQKKEHDLVRVAGVLSYGLQHKRYRHRLTVNLRQEWNDFGKVPFLPQLQAKMRLTGNHRHLLYVQGSVQRTYRLPTLNEWYYFPGGNPRLLPEQGWGTEVGLDYQWVRPGWALLIKPVVFDRTIRDWIYWLGGGIWTPHNIAAVNSRGAELYLAPHWQLNDKISLGGSWSSTYTRAVTKASYIPNDKSIGKQIPYSPRLVHQGSIEVRYGNWSVTASGQYIGYRYTTTDESDFIDDYFLAQASMLKKWHFGSFYFNTTIYIDNLTNNRSYRVVKGRPMPPLHAGLAVSCRL